MTVAIDAVSEPPTIPSEHAKLRLICRELACVLTSTRVRFRSVQNDEFYVWNPVGEFPEMWQFSR